MKLEQCDVAQELELARLEQVAREKGRTTYNDPHLPSSAIPRGPRKTTLESYAAGRARRFASSYGMRGSNGRDKEVRIGERVGLPAIATQERAAPDFGTVAELVAALPARTRAIALLLAAGRSYRDIAAELKCGASTIRSAIAEIAERLSGIQ